MALPLTLRLAAAFALVAGTGAVGKDAPAACASGGACENEPEDGSLLQARSGVGAHKFPDKLSFDVGKLKSQFLKPQAPAKRASSVKTGTPPYHECELGTSQCSFESMDKTAPTIVTASDPDAVCMNGDPYRFVVYPGSKDYLAIIFQSGGFCWNLPAFGGFAFVDACQKTIQEALFNSGLDLPGGAGFPDGVFNLTDPRNPFRAWAEYTIIQPLYCSGDGHMGNGSFTHNGQTLFQHGYHNLLTVKSWALENFGHKLASLVIGGVSAGGLGVQAWANDLLSSFKYWRAAVLVDSMVGILPESGATVLMNLWGGCSVPLFLAESRAKCAAGTGFSISEVVLSTMQRFYYVPFGFVQSKGDLAQVHFYDGVNQTLTGLIPALPAQFSPLDLYTATNDLLEQFRRAAKNVGIYYVNGLSHLFFDVPEFYTATTASAYGPVVEGRLCLTAWVAGLISNWVVPSQCHGDITETPNLSECAKYLTNRPIIPLPYTEGQDE